MLVPTDPIQLLRSALGPTLREVQPSALYAPPHKAAAVAAILRPSAAGPEVLFIRRSERTGDPWSGHMAFPGGRYEPSDLHLLRTAIRETDEEVGVNLETSAACLGVLEDQDATGRGGSLGWPIRPFVFELTGSPDFSLSDEVSELVWAPIEPLLRGELRTTVAINYKGIDYDLPGWDLGGRVVWGLTYRMMSTLLLRLENR